MIGGVQPGEGGYLPPAGKEKEELSRQVDGVTERTNAVRERSLTLRRTPEVSEVTFRATKENPKGIRKFKRELIKLADNTCHDKKLGRQVVDRALRHCGKMVEGSENLQKTFLSEMEKIFTHPQLTEKFSEFLDEYANLRQERLRLIAHPQEEINSNSQEKIGVLSGELNTLLVENELSSSKLEKSLMEIGWGTNTQIFWEYLLNPFYSKEDDGFVQTRALDPLQEPKKLTSETELLAHAGYYPTGNMFQWGTHGFQVLARTKEGVPQAVEYKLGVAIPGKAVYETRMQVDFAPYLPEGAAKQEVMELFKLFKEMSSKAANREGLKTFQNKVSSDYEEGKILTFIPQEKFIDLLSYLTKLLGSESHFGEIDNKIAACIVGIADPDMKMKEVEDKSRVFFHPKVREFLAEVSHGNPAMKVMRAMRIVDLQLKHTDPEHLNRETFLPLYEFIEELEEGTGLEIQSERFIQEAEMFIEHVETRDLFITFVEAYRDAKSDPSNSELFEKNKKDFLDELDRLTMRSYGLSRKTLRGFDFPQLRKLIETLMI